MRTTAMRRFLQNRRRWQKIALIAFALISLAGGALYFWLFADLPSLDNLSAGLALPSTRLYDRHGRLLYEVIDPKGGRNRLVPLEQMPQSLVQATIATEDRYFYQSIGIDLGGIARALWINLQGGEVRVGGSTITQQVVRNLLFDPQQRAERSLRRKLREMILAIQLTARYSKSEILALYLNQTYYGNLAYGVQSAAEVYFGKDVSQLTLAESALLAGLPQAPALHDPLRNPQAAKARQRVVLNLMVEAGYITQEAADLAYAEPLQYGSGKFTMNAPHFVQEVWRQLERDFPTRIYEGGLRVITTLDLDWQRAAEEAARRHLALLNTDSPEKPSSRAAGAAVVAIDPQTGQLLVMVGSVDFFNAEIDGAINMAVVPRQPGSTLKPFVYALTFDPNRLEPWTPAKMVLDVTTPFVTKRGESYTPHNYGLAEHGPVSVREALASSYNIPAVVALDEVGVGALIRLLTQLGITTLGDPERYDLSIALGGGDVRLTELVAAYAALANAGRPIQTSMILRVEAADGEVLYEWEQPPLADPVIDERVAWLITDILSDPEARLPSFGVRSPLSIGRPAAVKTGTTTDFRDNWTVGYTPQIVAGVWVGNPNNEPMVNVSGVSGAGPIWHDFMRAVLKDKPELTFPRPEGLVQAEVCALSGLLPTPYCPQRRVDWFIRGTIPTKYDDLYQPFVIDVRTGLLADENTPEPYKRERVYLVLPQEARAWAARNGIQPPPVRLSEVARQVSAVRLLTPDPQTIFQLTPVIPRHAQRIKLSVAVPSGTQEVAYWLREADGRETLIARVYDEPYWAWWELEVGNYAIIARARLADGSEQASEPVPFRVIPHLPPDQRPPSGNAD
ncbi:MAG: penicillin-binding protein 1C [Candidatus Thermofonsia Clade 1 bacterium]|uniref:Penicillin-binding protein 1C n=1 Tax=Candidatus Thermofonsia Clade 1 bacterium TaxID=2364210 RepID=A0A2M8P2L4_9CHLR|nr:MAG: penicillin-binding protein 1C [Candidatus Thermofonsia Clade 1 bacterium]